MRSTDDEAEEQRRWHNLYEQLQPSLEASESEFEDFDLASFLQEARLHRHSSKSTG